ncbi:MAG: SUMF1/EgtB/PvdO family nonheme iron enzyme [Desulforhopalus sp.]|nr:SUMF1/EgtB/PvdO family nonheme iron enzyme [Desulforhopalus sp.]
MRLAVCGCLFVFTSPQNLMADSFTNSLGQIFILCPAGSFIMGSTEGEAWRGREERAHLISITDAFYIMATEVTQAQWRQLMGDNPSYFADCASCPVERVSWHDAQRFTATLNAKEKTEGYALPTEAQGSMRHVRETTAQLHKPRKAVNTFQFHGLYCEKERGFFPS